MKKFSLGDILNAQSQGSQGKPESDPFQIQQIPITQLKASEQNKYGIRDIDELAANIELLGLMHNLLVKEMDEDGMYEIISGHRRYHACKQLYEGGNEKFESLPCMIQPSDANAALTELRLISANSTARELTDWEKTWQAARIKELLTTLREKGYEFKGKTRKLVADILKVSPAQVGRMDKIARDLSSDFKREFKDEKINVTTAYDLSRKDKKAQEKAWGVYQEGGEKRLKEEMSHPAFDWSSVKQQQDNTPLPGQESLPDVVAPHYDLSTREDVIGALTDLANVAETCGMVPNDRIVSTCRAAATLIREIKVDITAGDNPEPPVNPYPLPEDHGAPISLESFALFCNNQGIKNPEKIYQEFEEKGWSETWAADLFDIKVKQEQDAKE